jgi:hypothetical protein
MLPHANSSGQHQPQNRPVAHALINPQSPTVIAIIPVIGSGKPVIGETYTTSSA